MELVNIVYNCRGLTSKARDLLTDLGADREAWAIDDIIYTTTENEIKNILTENYKVNYHH